MARFGINEDEDACDGKSTEIGKTKTSRGNRTLYLPDEVVLVLASRAGQAQKFGLGQVRDGYIAVDAACRPLRPERLSDQWKALCAVARCVSSPCTVHGTPLSP